MTTITARYETPMASRYLQQLCKHFDHKAPAEWSETAGHVTFEPGTCAMSADDQALEMSLSAAGHDDLQRLIFIVEVHLIRFAWRDEIDLTWHDEAGAVFPKSAKLVGMLMPEREKHAERRRAND